METLSEVANLSDKPATANEESDEKHEPKPKPKPTKKKIIRKKNKSKAHHVEQVEHNSLAEVKSPNSMAPFGIFESQTQKCQRLQHYLRKDIENFYKVEIQPNQSQLLDNLLNNNLIQLSDLYHKDLSEVWKEKICSLPEIRSYLEVVTLTRKLGRNFDILFDQPSRKYYACFPAENNQLTFHELSQFQVDLLQKRDQFMNVLHNSQQLFTKKPHMFLQNGTNPKMSELSVQIAFLFKSLYDSTKLLKSHVVSIKQNCQIKSRIQGPTEPYPDIQNKYTQFLLKKLASNALKDEQIDFLNFFKNNQLVEHNYGPPQVTLNDQKQFEEFMRKKKNKKGKKGKYVLHTACLGCCSSYYEQYNPFSYCQECYIRFHRSCYTGFPGREELVYINPRQEKDVVCQGCYHKRINPNYKIRGSECDYCGLKGLLGVPAGQFKRIHIFCMLMNGLWAVRDGRIEFKSKTDNKIPTSDYLKCVHCNSGVGYLHFCTCCEKYAHASCAFFNGWKMDAEFDKDSQNVQLRLQCCNGVPLAQNEKRRKFVTNYKKQAYSF